VINCEATAIAFIGLQLNQIIKSTMKVPSTILFDLCDELRLPEKCDKLDADTDFEWEDLDLDLSDASDDKTVLD
jgi:hypothetical protein